MSVLPSIHYKFDSATSEGVVTNAGTFLSQGNAVNITLVRDTVINTSQQLIGTGCLAIFSPDATASSNNQTVYAGQFGLPTRHQTSLWFKSNTYSTNTTIYAMRQRVDNYSYVERGIRINIVSGRVDLVFYGYNGQYNVQNQGALFDNNWHHIYWSCIGNQYMIYIDNVQVANNVFIGSNTSTLVTKMTFGSGYTTDNKPFNGYIDDFRMWLDITVTNVANDVSYLYKLGKNIDVASLSGLDITTLRNAGATPAQQLVAGKTIAALQTTLGYTILQLYEGGITIAQLIAAPYTFAQLYAGGITITQFISASYTVLQLINGGITIDNLLTQYTYTQLIDNSVTKTQFDSGGKTIQNLIAGGVTISKLVTAQYSFSQMIAGGVTSTQFSAQSYSIANLVNGGATNQELLVAGYTFDQFQSAGIFLDWNIDVRANHIIKSYIKDFIDVSGSMVLRENSNLYISGNTETAGNLLLNRLFVTADASFNRRIFVGGDLSMNGNVTVSGDLSMNGTVTKCSFNNSSVPKTAFSGTVPDGADYTTSNIVYDQTFQANDDVSMNGATFASNNVKVSGNIVFGDGTVMNTYDNNILSTNPTVFKPSTFTALDICGNLVAGSYATSSDYRIKTNVVELDETYTVDKLRPVKYYQTQINREKYGLIAHELQEHYPELVIGTKDGSELQRVNYTGLIAILINDIKRLKRELEVLELHQR